jgi:hypothetical protein
MRDADEEHGNAAVPDGQQLDRPPLGRGADGLEAREPRELLDQGPRAPGELLEGEELPEVGDPGQQRVELGGGRYDSSFEE